MKICLDNEWYLSNAFSPYKSNNNILKSQIENEFSKTSEDLLALTAGSVQSPLHGGVRGQIQTRSCTHLPPDQCWAQGIMWCQ